MAKNIKFEGKSLRDAHSGIKAASTEISKNAVVHLKAAKNNANWKCPEKARIAGRLDELRRAMSTLSTRVVDFSNACNFTASAFEQAEKDFDNARKAMDRRYTGAKTGLVKFISDIVALIQKVIKNNWETIARNPFTAAVIGMNVFMQIAGTNQVTSVDDLKKMNIGALINKYVQVIREQERICKLLEELDAKIKAQKEKMLTCMLMGMSEKEKKKYRAEAEKAIDKIIGAAAMGMGGLTLPIVPKTGSTKDFYSKEINDMQNHNNQLETLVAKKMLAVSNMKDSFEAQNTISTPVQYKNRETLSITSSYGNRTLNGKPDFHKGIDYGPAKETDKDSKPGLTIGPPIKAMVGGIVLESSWDHTKNGNINRTGLGNYVIILGTDGRKYTYGHLSVPATGIEKGGYILSGTEIGRMGNTGQSTATHLHLRVDEKNKNGGWEHKDPEKVVTNKIGSSVCEVCQHRANCSIKGGK